MNTNRNIILISILVLANMLFFSCNSKTPTTSDTIVLKDSWQIQSQDKTEDGKKLSLTNYQTKNWTNLTVPNTILAGLVEAEIYKDIYKDKNLEKIPTKQFEQPWWYRTQFEIKAKQNHELVFEGINYRANVWLNGNLIADSSAIEGAFGIWNINITPYILEGENILAVQVFPPKNDDLTIGFVDWNPAAPDKNLGIWRPVKLKTTGIISIEEPFVKTEVNTKTLASAELTITTRVTNHSNKKQEVELQGTIEQINFNKVIELLPNETQKVEFNPSEYKQLNINNPKLWWPNLMGEPNLYKLDLKARVNNQFSDVENVNFGIRKVEDYWTDENHKGYKINGKKVLIKGAGWVDDILLADSDEKVIAQMEYVKHMNLNCVRLEGFWGKNKTLYEKADELGILLMIGWSCHWEWNDYCGRYDDDYMAIRTPDDMELQARAFQDQVKWLQNHPSIFTWVYGSDKLPLPELEEKLNKYIGKVDGTRPILASCKYTDFDLKRNNKNEIIGGYINESKISGPTGVKMLGPYAYTTPNYWYLDKRAGGAYGFNTETGPGPQVPPIESIKKMISEKNIWPFNDTWDYHSGRHEFSTLNRYNKAFNARYGEATSAEDYAFRSQISNYEAIRAMYEAFEVNKHSTTGIVQWMLNSAWPEMFWQLYDWYLMPNGAFYGTKTACQPINVIYNYGDKNIYLSNSFLEAKNDLEIEATVYDINSEVIFSKIVKTSIDENSSKKIIDLQKFDKISSTYFININITSNGYKIASNFYWLSTKPDVHDWQNSEWFFTPYKSYADFNQLNSLKKVEVKSTFSSIDTEIGDKIVECKLENTTSEIAFFIELSVKNKNTNETILPVFWDDNYISLMPGEKRTITALLQKQYVQNNELTYHIQGSNLK